MTEKMNADRARRDVSIKLRMDVDYAYPSRQKSFVYTFLGLRGGKNYLRNAKIIARMVNDSPKNVKVYWFFTPTTLPDKDMMALMSNDRHEAALHVAINPYKELGQLEKVTKRKVNYYTVHGTERLLARFMWHRNLFQSRVPIPEGFPLKNFWDFSTVALDREAYSKPVAEALRVLEKGVAEGRVIHAHPEWLFKSGGRSNQRGPYYEVLKTILGVDCAER